MKGDFSRQGFDKSKHYTRVNMQQGRLQVDRDWNEQQEIVDYRLTKQLQDLVGKHGAPDGHLGFQISTADSDTDVEVKTGHYYVDGALCENEADCLFNQQPYINGLNLPTEDGNYLFYLDTWQQDINYIHDAELLDPGLDGRDTTTRMQLMWQVSYQKLEAGVGENAEARQALLDTKYTRPSTKMTITQSKSAYMNHLLRFEVHQMDIANNSLHLKWDMENASRLAKVTTNPEALSGTLVIQLESGKHNLEPEEGQWIEIRNKNQEYLEQPGMMAKIQNFDVYSQQIRLSELTTEQINALVSSDQSLFIRQWTGFEQNVSLNAARQLTDTDISLTLDSLPKAGVYWQVAMRQGYILNAEVEPQSISHSYASLAKLSKAGALYQVVEEDRQTFSSLTNIKAMLQKITEHLNL